MDKELDPTVSKQAVKFPEGFLWGASTSHFQVEGHPEEYAHKRSDWAQWTILDGRIADRTTASQACEFYSRAFDDLKLLPELNLGAFRISLNWPTICPKAGEPFVQAEIEHYRKILIWLKERGIKTFVTLFHFCLPSWLAEEGGWCNPKTAQEFAAFAKQIAKEYHGLVDYWLTLNEPLAYAYQGYVSGEWPPGMKYDYGKAFLSIHNMLEGHAKAYQAIHEVDQKAQVSYTMHWRPFIARGFFNPLDQMVTHFRDAVFNHLFPNAIQTGILQFPWPISLRNDVKAISGPIAGLKGTIDYLALNYYTRDLCEYDYKKPVDIFGTTSKIYEADINAMGWESYPEGLYESLTRHLRPYWYDNQQKKRPIFITENGYATAFPADMADGDWSLQDEPRILYLQSHLIAMHNAIKYGANVKGYLHWALMDNFEWAEGLRIRFGLVRIAFPTQERSLRKSAHYYAAIARNNSLMEYKNGNS